MADATGTTTSTPVAPQPALSIDTLREICVPEKHERVILVPQCAYRLLAVADGDNDGLVGLPASAIEPLITRDYGAPSWHTWSGRYGHHELPIGYAMLVVRDGILRLGLQKFDSGD